MAKKKVYPSDTDKAKLFKKMAKVLPADSDIEEFTVFSLELIEKYINKINDLEGYCSEKELQIKTLEEQLASFDKVDTEEDLEQLDVSYTYLPVKNKGVVVTTIIGDGISSTFVPLARVINDEIV